MFEYRTYAGLDDQILKDGDVGFVGFNDRLSPDRLQPGLLADSQNIRFDRQGQAQVRKGMDLVSNPLSTGASALTLPFTLIGADINAGSFVVGKEYTIKTVGNTSFTSVGAASNTVGVVFTATGAGSGTGVATVAEIVVTATSDSGTLDITSSNAFTDFPSSGTINISDASGINADPNGDREFTKISASEIQISDQNYSSGSDSSVTLKFGILNDGAVNAIYASCSFSDPNASASQYIIFAANTKAVAVNTATGVTSDIGYPAAVTVTAAGSMLQAFNKVFIFRDGETALENNLKISTISAASISHSANTVTITTSTNHNLVTGDVVTINSLGFDAAHPDPNISGASITRTSDTQFTYALATTDGDETYTVSSSSVVTTDFTKVASGTYTQPTTLAPSGFTISNGLATATVSNTLSVGDVVTITTVGSSTLTKGTEFTVSEASTTEFKFFVNANLAGSVSDTVFTKRVSVGLGFSHMPAPPYAVYHQRRLVMPFKFSVAGTDSFTSRGILDEIIASDILDTDTYDQVFAQYRFNAGEADFNVALHSFSEDNLMVFNRNSIHLVTNTTSLQGASTKLLTNEVGCVARQSIQQVGNQVIFLSDNGVYSTQFFDEYNLRGTETPLSEPINVTIERINKAHQDKSVAVYFDNRYFLAVPLDSSTKNNAIIIYNFLNKQWESIDQVNNSDFNISNLLVVGEGIERGVYAVNDIGGVQKLNERVDGKDRVITQVGGSETNIDVNGSLTTRQYTLQSLDRKTWKNFEMHVESSASASSDLTLSGETENPDSTLTLGRLSDAKYNGSALEAAQDVSIRGRIGNNRGYGIQLTINNTSGRPKIRAIKVHGSTASRSTVKAI